MIARKSTWESIPDRCKCSVCREDGCSVTFAGEYVCPVFICVDCIAEDKKCPLLEMDDGRCDYLFFGRHGRDEWIGVIEIEGGRLDATEVIDQLTDGAAFVERLVFQNRNICFRPVVVHKKGMSKEDREDLRRKGKIALFGKKEKIRVQKLTAHFPMK